MEIELIKFKDMDLAGATIIDGLPTVGLVSSIAANYLIENLKLDQICALDSPSFPPISMIYASKPKFPVRMYADEKKKIAVFLSEFTPSPRLARPIAKEIFSLFMKNKCSRIISPEGIPGTEKECDEAVVHGIGSNDAARNELKKLQIEQLDKGIISGVSGVLLNEGRKKNFDVICLLVRAHPKVPDARAAAKIVETVDKLIPWVEIDVEPLYEEATKIEKRLRELRNQAKVAEPEIPSPMYG